MGFQERFCEAIAEWMRDYLHMTDVKNVAAVEQETEEGGYCETCAYTEIVVYITYDTPEGKTEKYRYYGDMGELISALD